MVDTFTLADLMRERYGQGYTAPQMQPADGEIYDTSNVRVPNEGGLTGWMRSMASRIRGDSRPDNVLAGGVDSAANWIDGRPNVGGDTAAPLGGGLLASFLARPRPRFSTPTEWPTEAAIRIADRTFTGPHHMAALERAQAALGPDALSRMATGGDGFITSAGRYVTRQEAARLVDGDYAMRVIPYMSEAIENGQLPIRSNYGWGSTLASGGVPGLRTANEPPAPDEMWWRQRP